MARDPFVVAGAGQALRDYGASASASPLVNGYFPLHLELEKRLATWHGFPHAMLMTSGYAANRSLLGNLPQKGDLVLVDRLAHNSILAGILDSGARIHRFPHNDLDHVEEWLDRRADRFHQVFVATETLFSMDGDGPDLVRLVGLRRKYRMILILDEAHAIGWYGKLGSGLLEHHGLAGQADLVVGTLGKSLGSQGAYVLSRDPRVRLFLANFAGDYIYSTFLAPSLVGAALASLHRIEQFEDQRSHWHRLSTRWREALNAQGFPVAPGTGPVVSVGIGDPNQVMTMAAGLRERKILVGAIRPPSVSPGTSRLRLSLHRLLEEGDLNRFLGALEALR